MLEVVRHIGPMRVKEIWFAHMPYEATGCELLEFHDCTRKYDVSRFKRTEAQTLVIDLTQNVDTIWNKFDKKSCRYEINRAEREGIEIKCPTNINEFLMMNERFRRQKKLGRVNNTYIETYGRVFVANLNNEILAGQVYLEDERTMRWLLGASILEGSNPIVSAANRALTWFAIQLAKSEGKREFDLGGYNEKAHPTISFFKRSFGGQVVTRYNYSKLCAPPIITDVVGGVWDVTKGLDIRAVAPSVGEGYRCSPSGDSYLADVFRAIGVKDTHTILDVGCGKGSAMLTMLKSPFTQVDGVEVSTPLTKIARQNLRRFGTRATVYNDDARYFDGYDKYNMVYFYNPFPDNVMLGVMYRLTYSLARKPRKMTVIYNNPTCHETVSGFFHKISEYPNRWGTGIYVYSN